MMAERGSIVEECFDRGWTDGLPVVPPYADLVDKMLASLGWPASEVLVTDATLRLELRAEQVASIAVMAGCLPAYGKVLRALTELLVLDSFNLRGIATTTGGAAVLVLVSGPIVSELGFAHGSNALGTPTRVNATIGRYAQLVRHLYGRAASILEEFGTIGHPGRYSYLLAEAPAPVWAPFHTQFDFAPGESVVGVVAAEGPISVNNHYAETGEQILETIASALGHAGSTGFYYNNAPYLVMLAPSHRDLVTAAFTRDAARAFVFERSRQRTQELVRIGRIPRHVTDASKAVDFEGTRGPVADPMLIDFIEAGGSAGGFSAVIPGWVGAVSHWKSLDTGRGRFRHERRFKPLGAPLAG